MVDELKILNAKIEYFVECLETVRQTKDDALLNVANQSRLIAANKRQYDALKRLVDLADDEDVKLVFDRDIKDLEYELTNDNSNLVAFESVLASRQKDLERIKNTLEKLYELRNNLKDSVGATHR